MIVGLQTEKDLEDERRRKAYVEDVKFPEAFGLESQKPFGSLQTGSMSHSLENWFTAVVFLFIDFIHI